jgi:hypothetical protein
MLLYLLNLDYPAPHAAGPSWTRARALAAALADSGGSASMIRAAWLELAARMFREPALHRRALAVAAAMRSAASAQGDLTGATIGMWVQQALWPSAPASAAAGAAKGSLPDLAVLAAIDRRDFEGLFPAAL